jgi:hypothetical protein
MNARKLALDLAELNRDERDELLAELPADKRAELVKLIDEASLLMRDREPRFETQWALLEAEQSGLARLRTLNDGQLRILLAQESQSVQRRLLAAIRASDFGKFPPAVHKVITEHLVERWNTSAVHATSAVSKRPQWWNRLWRRHG